jgi:hypothetical protein
MLALPSSSVALTDRSHSMLQRLVDRVAGDILELMVYSIEALRDRFDASLRRQ